MAVKHRYAHAIHSLAFLVLALSGLSLLFHGRNVFEIFFGGKKGAEMVHKYVAWVYLFTNAYLSLKILPEMGIRGSLTVKAVFQRLFYWFVFLSLAIMVPTGLVMMFKSNFGKGFVLFSSSIHETFALILITVTLVHAVLRFHKPEVLFRKLKDICRSCSDKPCIPVCPTGAIVPLPDGSVGFNDVRCIACMKCVEVCPYKVVYVSERGVPLYVKPV
jgi:ferredoxin